MRARPIVFKMAIGPSKASSSLLRRLAPRVQALQACIAFFAIASLYALARPNPTDKTNGMSGILRASVTSAEH